jgi:hypothetical protein
MREAALTQASVDGVEPARRTGMASYARVVILAIVLSGMPASARQQDCPLRFDVRTVGLPQTCLFVGRYNPTCGGALTAVFAGDGQVLVIGMAATPDKPILYLPARPLNATRGEMVRWQPDLDMKGAGSVGTVRLEDDGRTLRLRLDGAGVTLGDCPFAEYVGHFVDMVDAGDDGRTMTAKRSALLNP